MFYIFIYGTFFGWKLWNYFCPLWQFLCSFAPLLTFSIYAPAFLSCSPRHYASLNVTAKCSCCLLCSIRTAVVSVAGVIFLPSEGVLVFAPSSWWWGQTELFLWAEMGRWGSALVSSDNGACQNSEIPRVIWACEHPCWIYWCLSSMCALMLK